MKVILAVLPKIVNGLNDCDDDVKSVSASTLLHALPFIVENCKGIVSEVWGVEVWRVAGGGE